MLTKLIFVLAINSILGFTIQPIQTQTKNILFASSPQLTNLNRLKRTGTNVFDPFSLISRSTVKNSHLNKKNSRKNKESKSNHEHQLTLDPSYTGRNQFLKQWEYTEPSFSFPFSGTIDEFIQVQRFKAGDVWWLSPGVVADITSKNSRSPLKFMYGVESFREIYWPNDGHNGADISQFRLAVNCEGSPSNYKEKSIEIFFKNPETGKPEPFMYVYDGKPGQGEWTPVKEVFGMPIKDFCISCHHNKDGELVAFPKVIYPSVKDMKRSGYHHDFWELLVSDDSYWENN